MENSTDRGAWWGTVLRAAKTRTWLSKAHINIQNGEIHENTVDQMAVKGTGEGGDGEWLVNGERVSFGSNDNVLELDMVICRQV